MAIFRHRIPFCNCVWKLCAHSYGCVKPGFCVCVGMSKKRPMTPAMMGVFDARFLMEQCANVCVVPMTR